MKLLARDGRQRRTHGSESSWIPWRVEAAGVGAEGSLEALPVAWRGLGGVGSSSSSGPLFIGDPRGWPWTGFLRRAITARQRLGRGFKGLGTIREDH